MDKISENKENKDNQSVLTEEDIKALNIPPRDENSYPMPTKEEINEAGQFLFKLNLLASSLDLNLQAIIWNLYVQMNNYLNKDIEGASIKLATSLMDLKEYLIVSNNPIFKDINKNDLSSEEN